MSAPLISLQGLSKSFQGNDVVKCVDLTIDKGEFYGAQKNAFTIFSYLYFF